MLDIDHIHAKQVIIYGAQVYAASFYFSFKKMYPDIQVICFAVTDRTGNPDDIDGIKVCQLKDLNTQLLQYPVFIATPEFYQEDIQQLLEKTGFFNIIPVNSNMQYLLLKNYYLSYYQEKGKDFLTTDQFSLKTEGNTQIIKVFMAQSIYDKQLQSAIKLPDFVIKVQAGASLTDERCCEFCDNMGIHISDKNRNYCELTVAYWLWKNCFDTEYAGLCHYRRFLDIDEKAISNLEYKKIDAILPIPMMVYPNACEHHKRYIEKKDWNRMLSVLKTRYPDYYEASKMIFCEPYMYLHNIWILNKRCADKFLEWLFTILFELEYLYEKDEPGRFDRHMGYLGESLTTLYFNYHKDNLKIYHAKELAVT